MRSAMYLDLRMVDEELERTVRMATMHRQALANPATAQQARPLLLALLEQDERHIDFLRTLLLVNVPVLGHA